MVGAFHLLWVLWVIVDLKDTGIGMHELVRLGWLIGATVFWIAACDLRKWGAGGYLLLTIVNLILFITLKSGVEKSLYMSRLFVLDDIFSFFLLFFYKRFR
jgi:hypothetical protein